MARRGSGALSGLAIATAMLVLASACGGGGERRETTADRRRGTSTTAVGGGPAETTTTGPGATTDLTGATATTSATGKGGGSGATTMPPGTTAGGTIASLDPGSRTGVTDTEVTFGMHLPRSGAVGALVGNLWHGADAYFRYVNERGGVHGRKIRLVLADDGYSAQGAAGAIRQLEAAKVFAASGPAGVDQEAVAAEYANSKGIPYLHGPMSEAFVANRPWAFPVMASYPYGARRLMDYLFTKRGYTSARKLGAFYLNSDFLAKEAVPAAKEELARYRSRFVEEVTAEKDQSDFSAAITKLANKGVDTVWFAVDPTIMAKFAAQAKALQFRPQYVFMPPMGGDLYALAAGGNLSGAFGLATSADPQWPGTSEFMGIFRRYYPNEDPNEFTIVSYVIAKVFVEGLSRAGRNLGRDAFARAMATIDGFDTKVSSPVSYARRGRVQGANSLLAVWEIRGTATDQTTGFSF